ncbi:MAG: hypothetical protein H0X21_04525 [Actinobacteria bacterium]|nr:hypothetical protein [Actinomycetota bacterium]
MLKVEVILGVIASSIAILAFFAKAVANVRRGRREEHARKDSRRRSEISSGE